MVELTPAGTAYPARLVGVDLARLLALVGIVLLLLALVLQTAVKFVAVLGMIVSVFAVGRIALGVA